MTLQTSPDVSTTDPGAAASRWRLVLAHFAVLACTLWWGAGLATQMGGRDPRALSYALVLLLVASALVRPWEHLTLRTYGLLVTVGAAGWLVIALAPTGWDGADQAASWVYATQLAALLLAWAQSLPRRLFLLAAVASASAITFAGGWLAWWGGGDASHPFIGTFYWHNQQGAFFLMGAVASAALVLTRARSVRLLGWFFAPLLGAGVVITTSRGSMLLLAAAGICLAIVAAAWPGRRRALTVLAILAAAVAVVATVITGPPFFAERTSPVAGTQTRTVDTGQSLAVNGGHRLDDWVFAGRVFAEWPITGTGFHGFASASKQVDSDGKGSMTPYVHNGFLQVFTDGGLILGLPFLALLAAIATATWRLRRSLRGDWVRVGGLAVLGALLLHSGMDFDWGYPALLAAPAVAAAVLLGAERTRNASPTRLLVGGLSGVLMALSIYAAWPGALHLNVIVGGSS